MKPQCVIERGKPHRFKTGRIDILKLTAERSDADEIGRSMHQCRKSPFLGVSQPLLEGDRCLIGSGIQQQLLCSGWKRAAGRTCGEYRIAAESDWRGHDVQVAVAGYVGKDKFLST